MQHWFSGRVPWKVIKKGKVIYKGEIQNNQRVGEWIENGKKFFYVRGVQIPAKLYNTPPENLDPMEILSYRTRRRAWR